MSFQICTSEYILYIVDKDNVPNILDQIALIHTDCLWESNKDKKNLLFASSGIHKYTDKWVY